MSVASGGIEIRMQRRILFTVLITVASIGSTSSVRSDEIDHYVNVLTENGISENSASIGKYLHSIRPNSKTIQRLKALIAQLGDADFFRREQAMGELVRMPMLAPELLKQAAAGNDPEIRWRAKQVMKLADHKTAQLLYALFRVVSHRKLKGLTEPILLTLPLCEGEYLVGIANKAVVATASPDDLDLFLRTITKGDTRARVASIDALDRLLKQDAEAELAPLLTDKDEHVRFAAARVLINRGHRKSLQVLVALLDSENAKTRTQSIHWLRGVSGKRFGFLAFEEAKNRTKSVAAWHDWLKDAAPTAELTFPVAQTPPMLGRTLICYYNTNRVVEFDAAGKEVWSASVKMPYGCQGLPNGHRLVASYTNRTVTEFDAAGKIIWKLDNLPKSPFGVQRLVNGNTLVACSDSKKVMEYRPDKTVAWEATVEGRPMDARRLENGNTLVTLQNAQQVVEIDRGDKIVWKISTMYNPLSAERLENGNTLVCQMSKGRIAEIDRAGKLVWEHAGLSSPHRAQRLLDGTTLLIHSKGAKIVDRAGKEVWSKTGSGMGGISRF
jgi:hypothetical protein